MDRVQNQGQTCHTGASAESGSNLSYWSEYRIRVKLVILERVQNQGQTCHNGSSAESGSNLSYWSECRIRAKLAILERVIMMPVMRIKHPYGYWVVVYPALPPPP